ncbi:hypothetical protein ADH76_08030 [Enterocloster clostridioformis]|nr:condensation domain-containing protein [Enterocloster clostridioformis]ANU49721.1 hypothetical protein A4V08_31705 [Lachnoclostridium sp. YL32]NDO28828.1 hypothetical protein [Enterocloster clostridioformis]OXE71227.1 hypothetical protein ADH76_08030 [Enterocloster clostridioformis]QQR01370.1 hypothetical protein I5Q83_02945 [Enterocloster clostridioformis]
MKNIQEQVQQLIGNKKRSFYEMVKAKGAVYNIYPLSDVQKGMWFLYELDKQSPYYNVPFIVHIEGELDVDILNLAFKEIILKNTILRTRLFTIYDECFQYYENDFEFRDIQLQKCTQEELSDIVRKEYEIPFDLMRDYPIRYKLLNVNEKRYSLIICIHHMFVDGWTIGLIYNDLMDNYKNILANKDHSENMRIKRQYHSFVEQQENLDKENAKKFWKEQLCDASTFLRLPVNYPRLIPLRNEAFTEEIARVSKKQIDNLAREQKVTPYSLFLTIFFKVLTLICGQENITVGTPILNRDLSKYNDTYGLFVNTVPINILWEENAELLDMVQKVNLKISSALENGMLAINEIMNCAEIKRIKGNTPLYQVLFTFQTNSLFNRKEVSYNLDGSKLSFMLQTEIDNLDLQFDFFCLVIQHDSYYQILCSFRKSLFSVENIHRISSLFRSVIEGVSDGAESYNYEYKNEIKNTDYRDRIAIYEKKLCNSLRFEQCDIYFIRNFCFVFYVALQKVSAQKIIRVLEQYMDNEFVIFKLDDTDIANKQCILKIIYNDFPYVIDVFYRIRQSRQVNDVRLDIDVRSKAEIFYIITYISDYVMDFKSENNKIILVQQQYNKVTAKENENEKTVKEIIVELLGVETIATEDDIFHLGCTSIKSIRLCKILNKRLGTDLNVADIYRYSTISKLVEYIEKSKN